MAEEGPPLTSGLAWKVLAVVVPMVSVVGTYSALWISFLNRLAIVEAKLAAMQEPLRCQTVFRTEKTGKP